MLEREGSASHAASDWSHIGNFFTKPLQLSSPLILAEAGVRRVIRGGGGDNLAFTVCNFLWCCPRVLFSLLQ